MYLKVLEGQMCYLRPDSNRRESCDSIMLEGKQKSQDLQITLVGVPEKGSQLYCHLQYEIKGWKESRKSSPPLVVFCYRCR